MSVDIAKVVRQNLKDFYTPIKMPGDYSWSHVNTLKFINLYYNSIFESGEYDEQGYRKHFYNIVKQPCDVASKFIDLDTKDVILTSKVGGIEHKMWLMMRDLKDWLGESKFATFLNQVGEDLPHYGSVVGKRLRSGKWDTPHIENLRMDTRVAELRSSGHVYEAHLMSRWEVEGMTAWDQEAVKDLLEANDQSQFIIYEAYHRVSMKKWERAFLTDFLTARDTNTGQYLLIPESNIDPNAEYEAGKVLYTEELPDIPYRETHWEKVAGRWLGRGFVEYLLPNQMRQNEISLGNARALRISNTPLFWTQDETIGRNVLSDMEPGQIIKGQISPVDNQERTLAASTTEEARWEKNTQQKTFSFEAVTGKNLPSNTPLGVVENAVQMIQSFFDKKRENFGLFVKEILLEDVIPAFKNDKRKSHILKFLHSDKDMEKLRTAITDTTMRKAFWDYAVRTGTIPSRVALQLERIRIEGVMKKRKDIPFEIPDGFYDDVQEVVDVIVTDEQLDVEARMKTLQTAMTTIGSNPALMQNPVTRTIFFKLLELAGVSPVEIDLLEAKATEQGLGVQPAEMMDPTQAQQPGAPGMPGGAPPQMPMPAPNAPVAA